MQRLSSRLDALSLRQRFLLVPSLAMLLIAAITLLSVVSYRSQIQQTSKVQIAQLARLDDVENQFSAVMNAHLSIFNLLHDVSGSLTEEQIYEQSLHHMDKFRAATFRMEQLLRSELPAVEVVDSALQASRQKLLMELEEYADTAVAAVELTTVNIKFATRELVRANIQFVEMNEAYEVLIDDEHAAISRTTVATLEAGERAGIILAAVGLAVAATLFLVSWLLANLMSRTLGQQITTLKAMAVKLGADSPAANSDNPIAILSGVIATFTAAIERLKSNELSLISLNFELNKANATLEEKVVERTASLAGVNTILQNLNMQLSQQAVVLQESEERARTLLDMMPDAVWLQHGDEIIYANEAAAKLFGAGVSVELLGTCFSTRVPGDSQERVHGWMIDVFQEKQLQHTGLIDLIRMDGSLVPVEMAGALINVRQTACILMVGHDVSERVRHAAEMEHQATHDALTDLPNRTLFRDRVEQAIGRAGRKSGRFSLMFIDLDKFKHVNDTMGHEAGDQLLKVTADRLLRCMRDSDTVARFGGDEFVLLIEGIADESAPSVLAHRIVQLFAAPILLFDQEVTIGCSIGISLYPDDGTDPDTLLKSADIAMYRAKENGRNNFQFFTQQMQERLREQLELERLLHEALEKEQFILHYQPQIDLRTGSLVCLEALIRWQSPSLGMVSPARFIPVAENGNLILAIGRWVIHKVCQQASWWREQGLMVVPIAINVSAAQFARQDVEACVREALDAYGIEPSMLELELTESLSMEDPDRTIALMHRMKLLGVSISIDDFGTGYSNLTYLKKFPVDKLKMDKSFVAGMLTDPSDKAIVAATIRMAHSLGLRIIGEGVETAGQVRSLLDAGCDALQGYYFSKPADADEIAGLLRENKVYDLSLYGGETHHRTLLLIDDQVLVLSAISQALSGQDIRIVTAGSAEEAYELLATHHIGVIVSDHDLPGEDGINFLSKAKKLCPDAARILLTAHDTPQTLARAINQGAVYRFIRKPINKQLLIDTLSEAFDMHENRF